ncbi:MAG: TraB/VirB10 family protein [Oligoflexales bacterium]
MKYLNKSDLLQAILKVREKPGILLLALGFILLLATYLFSKHHDTKIITYQNKEHSFNSGRVISRNNDLYKRKDKIYNDKVEDLEEKLESITAIIAKYEKLLANKRDTPRAENKEPLTTDMGTKQREALSPLSTPEFSNALKNFPTTIVSNGPSTVTSASKSSKRRKRTKRKGPEIISFPVQASKTPAKLGVRLPSGSFVKAKLLTGIEAPEGKALPVLLQADYAFIGPNKSRIDLSGCFIIAKSTGNMSIERVEMQATKISCVSKSGRSFERKLSGYIADGKDNSFAVMGALNSKQDRVASMAFLASVVDGIGKAVSQAQTTTTMGSNGGSTMNITGSQGRYIAASGASNAAATVTNWYLKHAEKLLPTINVGSGQEVWLIIQEPVSLPNWYFNRHFDQRGGISFLSNLLK